MSNELSIYHRIGEAISSNGLYNIVRASTHEEERILEDAGFIEVGSIKDDGEITKLYQIELKDKKDKKN